MTKNAHLDSFISSLDQLVYSSFVIVYILDANLLNLVIKCIAQLQFIQPKTHHPDRSLRFHVAASGLINFLTIVYHLLAPLPQHPKGILIDFVGQSYIPNRFQLLCIDLATAFAQCLLVLLAYESDHYGQDAQLDDGGESDDVPNEMPNPEERETDAGEAEESISEAASTYIARSEDLPLVNLRLRYTLHRIANDKPVAIVQDDLPTSGEADEQETSAVARIWRMRARIRARRRELAQTDSTGESTRLEEGSDEEREIGRPIVPPRPLQH